MARDGAPPPDRGGPAPGPLDTRRLLSSIGLVLAPAILAFGVLLAIEGMDALKGALGLLFAGAAGSITAFAMLRRDATTSVAMTDYIRSLGRFGDGADTAERKAAVPPVASGLDRHMLEALDEAVARFREKLTMSQTHTDAMVAVLDALPDPVVVVDDERRVRLSNAAARALLGTRMQDRNLATALRHPDILAAVDECLISGTPATVEYTTTGKLEEVFVARILACAPLPHRPGETAEDEDEDAVEAEATAPPARAALLTLHDITAQRRSEQMHGDFVANVSHELRTPLASLIGFIETIRGPARDDADARDNFLNIMEQNAGRMSRLVNDLLSLSRIELDENVPPATELDLTGTIETVTGTLAGKAEEHNVKIEVEIEPGLPKVIADADQMTQVIQNLTDNAIKYGGKNKTVRLHVRQIEEPVGQNDHRDMVAVSVTDQGPGVPKEHLPRLGERFYRVDPARSRALGGVGLGLSIVRHILNRHRGRFHVDSVTAELDEDGQPVEDSARETGTTFTFTVPVAKTGQA